MGFLADLKGELIENLDYRQELNELLLEKVEDLSLRLANEGVLDFETEFTRRFRFSRSDMKNAYFRWWNDENRKNLINARKTRRLTAKTKEVS